jgi:hypothetical protein
MSFIPNNLGESQNLQEGLTTESPVLQLILSVMQASKRHSYVVCSVSRRTANPKKDSWRTVDSIVNL